MSILELVKKISGKTVEEPRRQTNWDFPIKEYVQAMTVYTEPEEPATPALVCVSMEGGAE